MDRVVDTVPSVAGVVCFGSVARGEADRVSDIDVFVLVENDDELVTARRTVSDVKRDLEADPIDGQRYGFEVFVESVESARKRGADLQPILKEGVPLYETEALDELTGEPFRGDSE
ncbi:nucleotidyltransferase domain-containing protein [Halogeometricum borinquense]|uniref:nucleotidyltransferase domain-containing protein n=1 Tax=Halogeometricum borinquense TaxID=60847 RepID=UPI0019551745|nr:nucleotidyltransferase domain-containing protein [Halogeometricum borinquense]